MSRLDPEALVRHVDALYRAAWALCGSREDAEDLVQETYARLLAKPRTIESESERAYLLRTLRNTFLTMRRAASRRPQRAGAAFDDLAISDTRASSRPEQAVEAQELYAVIAAVADDFRLALIAVDIVGLSYREASLALGTGEATIATRLYRAREQVATALREVPASERSPE